MSPVQEERPVMQRSPVRLVRKNRIADKVVIVNGLPGCGKTLVAPIVGALARMEVMHFDYQLEHACQLRYLNAIDDDAAISLVRTYTDLDLYHLTMSREVNFRPGDVSSVFKNARPMRYLKRFFLPEGEEAVKRIQREKPILLLVTHVLVGIEGPILAALGDAVRIMEVIRHPLYMIKQTYTWMPRAGVDPRVFSLCFEYRGHSLPYYAKGWEEKFLGSNRMDRTIYALEDMWRRMEQAVERLNPDQQKLIMKVPFEEYVLRPEPIMKRLELFLGTECVPETRRMMKKHHVPRKMIADGIGLPIYKVYGWRPPRRGATEADELRDRRAFAAREATPEALAVLDRYSAEYEEKYMKGILSR
ncbi:MAG: hypothetical protein HYY14_02445 [Candidatus Omnitrophica bacterium]|nr:hypothetical protein [Candidatus Omnitrophota bacterium]